MKKISPVSEHVIYYQPLLERYALRIVKDKPAATALAKQVLQCQYAIDKLAPSAHLRKVLQFDLRNRCLYWIQSRIFDREIIKVPYNIQQPGATYNKTTALN